MCEPSFDEGDILRTTQSLSDVIGGERAYTVEGWLKAANQPQSVDWLGTPCGPRVTLQSDGRLQLHRGDEMCVSDTAVTDDAWHHIAMVVDSDGSSLTTLYVDGQLQCSLNDPALNDEAHLTRNLVLGAQTQGCPEAGQAVLVERTLQGQLGPVRVSVGIRYDDDFTPQSWLARDAETVFMSNYTYEVTEDGIVDEGPGRLPNRAVGAWNVFWTGLPAAGAVTTSFSVARSAMTAIKSTPTDVPMRARKRGVVMESSKLVSRPVMTETRTVEMDANPTVSALQVFGISPSPILSHLPEHFPRWRSIRQRNRLFSLAAQPLRSVKMRRCSVISGVGMVSIGSV